MANSKIKGITIEFRGETTKLEKAMRTIKSESKDVDKELKQVNNALKFNPGNTTLLAQKQQLLSDKIKTTNAQLKEFKTAQSELKSSGVDQNTTEWRSLEREIVTAQSKLKYFEGQLNELNASNVTTLSEKLEAAGDKLQSAGKKLATVGAGASLTGAGLIAAGSKFIESAEAQVEVEDKLTTAYSKHVTGGKEAAKSTMELASALQQEGVVGDEVTLAGAQQLANYTNSSKAINSLLPVMDNLLVKQKGLNGTQDDATAIGKSLGKALAGNSAAFTKLGISLTDEQKDAFKAMTENERLAFIIETITEKTGDMNAEFAKTDSGQLQQAKNTIGDMAEEVGKALLPAVADVAKWLGENILPKVQELINFAQSHPMLSKIALGITAILTVGGPLLVFIGSMVTAVGAITTALGAFGAAELVALGPIALIVAAIAAVIAIIVLCVKHWDTIKKKVTEVAKAIWVGVKAIGNSIKNFMLKVISYITAPFRKAWNLIKKLIAKIKGIFPFHVKMPHIGITPKGWKASDLLKGSLPHFGLSWYKNGGVFNSPSVIGVGEAGSEAVVPLDQFWTKMDDMTASIVNGVRMGMATAGTGGAINITVELGGTKVGEQIVKLYDRTKKAVG